MTRRSKILKTVAVLLVGALTLAAGYATSTTLTNSSFPLTLTTIITIAFTALYLMNFTAKRLFTKNYDVGVVEVHGPITRDAPKTALNQKKRMDSDDIVEKIKAADDDPHIEGLLVRINTPGGEIVPSNDIRNAIKNFDGDTAAHITDMGASGGYLIASACDVITCRENSLVGSIGVIGSRQNFSDLADALGVEYERLVAGQYKDAGTPWKELEHTEREYLQGLIDSHYDNFLAAVTEDRDVSLDTLLETKARVFLGHNAKDYDLVDAISTERTTIGALLPELEDVRVKEYTNNGGFSVGLSLKANTLAAAFGQGLGNALTETDDEPINVEARWR